MLSEQKCAGNCPTCDTDQDIEEWDQKRSWRSHFSTKPAGRLLHILAVVDKLPDKLRPWRLIQRSYLKIGRTTHSLPIPRSWVQWIPALKILVRTNDRLSMEILWPSINDILSSPPLLLDLPLHFSSCNGLLLDRDLCVFPSWLVGWQGIYMSLLPIHSKEIMTLEYSIIKETTMLNKILKYARIITIKQFDVLWLCIKWCKNHEKRSIIIL